MVDSTAGIGSGWGAATEFLCLLFSMAKELTVMHFIPKTLNVANNKKWLLGRLTRWRVGELARWLGR